MEEIKKQLAKVACYVVYVALFVILYLLFSYPEESSKIMIALLSLF